MQFSPNMVTSINGGYMINLNGIAALATKYNVYPDRLVNLDVECWVSSRTPPDYLTYNEMLFRLKNVKSLGADGCFIWAGGVTNTPSLNSNGTGLPDWAQAILDFNNNNCQYRP